MLAIISIGSNLGDRQKYLQFAVDQIASIPQTLITKISSVYETMPQVYIEQPNFYNAVLEVDTILDPLELLSFLRNVEQVANRERTVPNGPRTLDLDVISYNNEKIIESELEIPHPRAHLRQFVLMPWLEIDSAATLIGYGDVRIISERLGDQGVVRLEKVKLI